MEIGLSLSPEMFTDPFDIEKGYPEGMPVCHRGRTDKQSSPYDEILHYRYTDQFVYCSVSGDHLDPWTVEYDIHHLWTLPPLLLEIWISNSSQKS